MSSLVIDEKSGKILDVKFAFVRIQKPVPKYQSKDTEYSVDVVVDKATAKQMKKQFPKNSVREIDTADFEAAYKFTAPYPDQDEQFIVKFRSDSHYKDGTEKEYKFNSRPKVYVPSTDGKVKDVTLDTQVSNGSTGDVAFSIRENDYGVFHSLVGILVKELIEYKPVATKNAFGEVEPDSDSEKDNEAPF